MKHQKYLVIALTFFISVISCQAFADGQRFAVINAARIMRESHAAIEAKQRVERDFSAREKALVSQGESLKAQSDKFEKEAQGLSDALRTQRRAKLAEQSLDFQKKKIAFSEEKNAVLRANAQTLISLAKRVVAHVAEVEKYDVVLQEAVYVSPEFDITDKVIAGMNAEQAP